MRYKIIGWCEDDTEVSWESSRFEFPEDNVDITKRYSRKEMTKWNIFKVDKPIGDNPLLDTLASYEVTHLYTGFTWRFEGILNSKDSGTLTLYGKMSYNKASR